MRLLEHRMELLQADPGISPVQAALIVNLLWPLACTQVLLRSVGGVESSFLTQVAQAQRRKYYVVSYDDAYDWERALMEPMLCKHLTAALRQLDGNDHIDSDERGDDECTRRAEWRLNFVVALNSAEGQC